MADWKTHINYNYNPNYLAYAYGHMFQPGSVGGLVEPEVADLSSTNAGVTPIYAPAADAQEESPPRTPEQHVPDGHYHFSEVVYIGGTAGRFLLAGSRQAVFDDQTQRSGCDSASDSDTHISPDSWGFTSGREEALLQTDPTGWIKRDPEEDPSGRSPDARGDVSGSFTEEPGSSPSGAQAAPAVSKNPSTPNSRAKSRTAFTESQMNILSHKFSVQKYLPPSEMKNLAVATGLTYKQVKTWFQNRRMKLKRHQKDTSWVPERYATNSESPAHRTINSIAPYSTPYQGEGLPPHMMDTAFKNIAPQNVAFYMAAMGPGSTGYPGWTTIPCQAALPIRTQQRDWPPNPNSDRYEYNPHVFNVGGFASGECTGLESRSVEGGADGSP